MRQIFENVWEVDIRGKNMWFQRKSRTAEKIPKDNSTDSTGMSNVCQTLRRSSKCFQTRCSLKCSSKDDVCTKGNDRTSKHLGWSLVFLAFSPHLCVGFLFLVVHSRLPPPASRRLPHSTYSHTTYPHTTCQHTTCSHTTCSHTTYSHTNFLTHTACPHTTYSHTTYSQNLITHTTCPRTTCSHTIYSHTTYSHTTCQHTTDSHITCSHTTCQHTTYSHTACSHTTCPHTHLTRTQLTMLTHDLTTHKLGHIDLHFAWQAWHLATSTFTLRFIDVHSAWQVCVTLRGRRGTWRHRPPLCVAGAALMPKGSCHRDESSINHTLAQNSHCEFWCGMHLTCTNTND